MSGISKRVSGSWVSGDYGIMGTATDTIATLPAVLYPNDTTATVGLKGNTVQSGTPTPDNPIMPQGTGERTENLAYGRIDGVNIGSNGTIFRADGYNVAIGSVESGIVYTINSHVFAFYTDEPTIGSVSYDGSRIVSVSGTPTTFTAPITGYVAFRLSFGEQAMLNLGSTALPYEPYGIKIPISSANTTTPVYLGEVESTRQMKKLVLTGEESGWNRVSSGGRSIFYLDTITPDYLRSNDITLVCSHYKAIAGVTGASDVREGETSLFMTVGVNQRLYFGDSNYTAVDDFKTYLAQQYAAGTPVCIWYVLATPETGIVNEPLMKIGDYADEVSGITIPTIAGGDTLSVDTTVQPSEVTVNYKGWHPVADVHERDNGAWT